MGDTPNEKSIPVPVVEHRLAQVAKEIGKLEHERDILEHLIDIATNPQPRQL